MDVFSFTVNTIASLVSRGDWRVIAGGRASLSGSTNCVFVVISWLPLQGSVRDVAVGAIWWCPSPAARVHRPLAPSLPVLAHQPPSRSTSSSDTHTHTHTPRPCILSLRVGCQHSDPLCAHPPACTLEDCFPLARQLWGSSGLGILVNYSIIQLAAATPSPMRPEHQLEGSLPFLGSH